VTGAGRARTSTATAALVLRRTEYRDGDLIVLLFTEMFGRLSALARNARRSRRRFGGALEPFHLLDVRLEPSRGDLFTMLEASIIKPRTGLLGDLERLDAAGTALAWVRSAAPDHTPEPELFRVVNRLLDRLAAPENARQPRLELAESGLGLLRALGWGLAFDQCVRCGRRCSAGRSATLTPALGGLVCRACGGGDLLLSGDERARFASAAASDGKFLIAGDDRLALRLVEQTLKSHGGIDLGDQKTR